jgi:uncharacterized protein (UPF0276 family)
MVDNFLHLRPEELANALPYAPLAFHVMNSRFLRRDEAELAALAKTLKPFIRELRPLYVSDHLAVFTAGGRRLPFPQEIDYEAEGTLALDRARLWQDLLGVPVLFENYPSILDGGRGQPRFLDSLLDAGAGLLLDLSNAVIAAANGAAPLDEWEALARRASRFHAAGYGPAGTIPDFLVDSHDSELSSETLSFLRRVKPLTSGRDCSIVIERDANIELSSWSRDLAAAREAFA